MVRESHTNISSHDGRTSVTVGKCYTRWPVFSLPASPAVGYLTGEDIQEQAVLVPCERPKNHIVLRTDAAFFSGVVRSIPRFGRLRSLHRGKVSFDSAVKNSLHIHQIHIRFNKLIGHRIWHQTL
jgi:hypothetical protein